MTFTKESDPPDQLQKCLDLSEQESEIVEDILGSRPESVEELRPVLLTAAWLCKRNPDLEPRPGFVRAGHLRLVYQIRSSQTGLSPGLRPAQPFSWLRLALRVALFCLLFAAGFLVASGLADAAQTWLPGDPTYFLKSAQEDLALGLATTPFRKASLHSEYANRRLLEAQALAFEGRYEQLPSTVADFSSHVEAALDETIQAAQDDPERGFILATRLKQVLDGQRELVALLASATPRSGSGEFGRVLQVSQTGLEALQDLLNPGGQGI